jgi:3-O-methylgallate 3,4-dioxygenase
LQSLPRNKLNAGSSEILNWVALAGAVEHLDLDWFEYVPGYRTPAGTGTGLSFATWA